MWASVRWIVLSSLMAFLKSSRAPSIPMRISSCRFSTRSTRQMVTKKLFSYAKASTTIDSFSFCFAMKTHFRHNSDVGQSREDSNMLAANFVDKIHGHCKFPVTTVPRVSLELLWGRWRERANVGFGYRIRCLRGLATQQNAASARSARRVSIVQATCGAFRRSFDRFTAAILLHLVFTAKVSERGALDRCHCKV